jgi:1-acyl-sn-glycerol-3-phosphate acyltransferase
MDSASPSCAGARDHGSGALPGVSDGPESRRGGRSALTLRDVWTRPLPHMRDEPSTRLMCRTILTLARRRIRAVTGEKWVQPERDPFVVVCNHGQRLEALIVPTLLIFLRGGKRVHFMADWNFLLVPLVASAFRRSQVIVIGRKDARPRWLNHFRPRLTSRRPPLRQALDRLAAGCPVGVFPEGTVNRDPAQLLRGETGAARIVLHAGVPIVPLGIRYHDTVEGEPIPERAPLSIEIGPPVSASPRTLPPHPNRIEVHRLHARIMNEISRLSGKRWPGTPPVEEDP